MSLLMRQLIEEFPKSSTSVTIRAGVRTHEGLVAMVDVPTWALDDSRAVGATINELREMIASMEKVAEETA